MATISFPQHGLEVELEPGATLLDAARRAGIEIESPCNGGRTCGKCRVFVQGEEKGTGQPDRRVERLACETEVAHENLVVTFPPSTRGKDRVLLSGQRADRAFRPWVRQEWDERANRTRIYHGDELSAESPGKPPLLGLAVDIGTTTLVVSLLDLETGAEAATVGALNPQTRLGHDVLSRIQIASEPQGLAELQRVLTEELNRMTLEALRRIGASPECLHEIVLSGNTTMLHLVAGVNPRCLGRYPYTPALRGATSHLAREFRLVGGAKTRAYLPPVFDGFVGADISAGVLATGLRDLRGVSLFIDIGTNGEMVLAVDGRLVATSTAAGPAFEGMNITFGMRAAVGAIEKVAIDENGIHAATIGKARPRGVCGSGLLDAVSELVRSRLVDASGRIAKAEAFPEPLGHSFVTYRDKPALCLAHDADTPEGMVLLTQQDVRQVQLAKGAVRAGVDALLAHENLLPHQVDRVLLAGSFGAHLQPSSLVGIGLLPEVLGPRVQAVGNTSRTGAEALLLDWTARDELLDTVAKAQVIDLAHAPGFEKTFVKSMGFPSQPTVAG